ncbi:cupin-like domain-containing protein [Leptolyngbya ohadii]|uniref:cupin-like domain-containing protein n=1 Tax=Leptolyngbya ohadii TaxID=1962290 RepID=UPI000B598B7B|nr:cupin-like domain-containing protein [Leptolyngbya ohadii]
MTANPISPVDTSQTHHSIARINIANLTADWFFREYKKSGIPVVLTGIFQPNTDWNLDYLSDLLGNQEFVLRYYGKARYQQDKRQWTSIGSGVAPQTKSFVKYAELLRSGEAQMQDIYLAKCPIHKTPLIDTEAIADYKAAMEQIGFTQPASTINLWAGPGGHVESLHYDVMDGTLIQLHGSKRVVLFPRSQTSNLYPFPFYVHLWHGLKLRSWFSQVYPDRPDYAAFPKLKAAMQHRVEVILHPGELLYIPAGWWHEVSALDGEMVCSLNRFWRVYPTPRAVFFWGRWRGYLGSLCAIPHTIGSLAVALFQPDRKQRIRQILQML